MTPRFFLPLPISSLKMLVQRRFFVNIVTLVLVTCTLFVYLPISLSCEKRNDIFDELFDELSVASANSASLHDTRINNFAAIDSHAERVPQHISAQPLHKFVAYLTKPAINDVEKARAIARWITSNIVYDFDASVRSKQTLSDNPDSVLLSRRAVDMGFANLFVKMMHSAGVEAFAISGVKKGVNFTPGSASSLKRHAWNAFRTGGKWYLVDLPVYKEVETNDSYKLIYADAFFCIQPEQMIYTNFPDDRRWQLLNNPITKDQFLTSVQCFGAFYGYAVTALTHQSYVIASKQRSMTLSFDAPHNMNLGARVYAEKDAKEQRTSIKCMREGKKHIVIIKFLADGDYKLEITATEYIKDRAHNEVVGCSVKTVAEYSVVVGEKAGKSMASVGENE
jgi:transglutaminase/protease-like cytokinesis protein 3